MEYQAVFQAKPQAGIVSIELPIQLLQQQQQQGQNVADGG